MRASSCRLPSPRRCSLPAAHSLVARLILGLLSLGGCSPDPDLATDAAREGAPYALSSRVLYVDGLHGNDQQGEGTDTRPFRTLRRAHTAAAPGDTVRIRSATYHEELGITKAHTTWIADSGHHPVIDGGYHEGLSGLGALEQGRLPAPDSSSVYLPGSAHGAMVRLQAEGVRVEGLIVQNIAGVGIASSGSNTVVRNCTVDFVYGACLLVSSGSSRPENVLVEGNRLTRCSVKRYDPSRDAPGPAGVQTCLQVVNASQVRVRRNEVAYCHAEGINAGKGSQDVIIEENLVHTNLHVHIYVCRGERAIVRNNFVYHSGLAEFAEGKLPGGIVIGDERASGYPSWSDHTQVYNNVVVGMGRNFHVRNNDKAQAGYDTQLDHSYVGFNTFVNATEVGVQIDANQRGRAHRASLFENNLILQRRGTVAKLEGVAGVTFRSNLWSSPPPAAGRGPGDQLGDPVLEQPQALITDGPSSSSSADPRNYRLTPASLLAIDRAATGAVAGGPELPAADRDYFGTPRPRGARGDLGAHER
ncbi:MAG: right-handed parallel beta-helix repeat-containing protein [Deltaproteobacteria bacterium]|nr:right-handed parallel beta-helix repeat-containing protein [Deltaproteobacteria bacterium]